MKTALLFLAVSFLSVGCAVEDAATGDDYLSPLEQCECPEGKPFCSDLFDDEDASECVEEPMSEPVENCLPSGKCITRWLFPEEQPLDVCEAPVEKTGKIWCASPVFLAGTNRVICSEWASCWDVKIPKPVVVPLPWDPTGKQPRP